MTNFQFSIRARPPQFPVDDLGGLFEVVTILEP
jgi:hypothetical protein